MPKRIVQRKPTFDEKDRDFANRLNSTYCLRAEQELSLRKIAKLTGVSQEQARLDLELLINSVKDRQAKQKLMGVQRTGEARAHRLNREFDFKRKGFSKNAIAELLRAEHFKMHKTDITRDFRLLVKSVKNPETIEMLQSKGRPRLTKARMREARRLRRVFNLRMKGLTQDQIAQKLGMNAPDAARDIKTLLASVK
ncbi:MAG: hypothetical protein NT067_06210 [Candidatus Diapherotrites archaeon]|nr:hypothetical protein [Candidatus Diapherotrites archaeon]